MTPLGRSIARARATAKYAVLLLLPLLQALPGAFAQPQPAHAGATWQLIGTLHRVPNPFLCSGVMGEHYNMVELRAMELPPGFPDEFVTTVGDTRIVRVAVSCAIELPATNPSQLSSESGAQLWSFVVRMAVVNSLVWSPGAQPGKYVVLHDLRRCGSSC